MTEYSDYLKFDQEMQRAVDQLVWVDTFEPEPFESDDDTPVLAKPRKSSAPRQSSVIIADLLESSTTALDRLSDVQTKAGPTVRAKISTDLRAVAVEGIKADREKVTTICAGQRAGLVRVLRYLQDGDHSFDLDDRVRRFMDTVLDLSANMAVLSDCGWTKTRRWLIKAVPIIADNEMTWLETRFRVHLRAAEAELARRIPIKLSDYRTAPSPREIAERLQITTVILREARANKCGLTSIDPEPKKDRDRRNAEKRRRADGRKPQAERNKDADLKALAQELGCTLRTLYNHLDDLDAYVAKLRAKRV